MTLGVVTKDHAETVRRWRNLDINAYRTPYPLTPEMQEDFYYKVICNRDAKSRFWSVYENECFIGMVGLVNISFENRSAEISIVIDPELRGQGFGNSAVRQVMLEGFNRLNLDNIYGECYMCSPSLDFWLAFCKQNKTKYVVLPRRKFVDGKYHDSIYFNFERGQ